MLGWACFHCYYFTGLGVNTAPPPHQMFLITSGGGMGAVS